MQGGPSRAVQCWRGGAFWRGATAHLLLHAPLTLPLQTPGFCLQAAGHCIPEEEDEPAPPRALRRPSAVLQVRGRGEGGGGEAR